MDKLWINNLSTKAEASPQGFPQAIVDNFSLPFLVFFFAFVWARVRAQLLPNGNGGIVHRGGMFLVGQAMLGSPVFGVCLDFKEESMSNYKKNSFGACLKESLSEFNISLDEDQVVALTRHYDLLKSWNLVHNLTTVTEQSKAIYSHYVDCLLGLSFIEKQETVWDFGSGGGFPGLVAAVLWPETKFVLVEASRKKCSFLLEASRKMLLKNVSVSNSRVEKTEKASFALSRATFSAQTAASAAQGLKEEALMAVWAAEGSEDLVSAYEKAGLLLTKTVSYEIQGFGKRKILFFTKKRNVA